MKSTLEHVLNGEHLSEAQAEEALHRLAKGTVDPIQAGAFLIALRAKGETAEEVRGFARAMRTLALAPDLSELPPDAKQVDASAQSGAQFIELHTGQFAEHFGNARARQRVGRVRGCSFGAHR